MEINPGTVLWSAPEAERAGRPTLVLLHGHRMDERVGFELRHHLPAELVFASVRGPREVSGGGYAWFPLDSSFSLEAIDHSAAAVLSWLDQVDLTGPVGVLGFSQGVATAFQMVRRDPARFAYAVNLSGGVVPFPGRGDGQLAARRLPVFWAGATGTLSSRPSWSSPPGGGCGGTPTSPNGSIRACRTTFSAAELADLADFALVTYLAAR